MIMQYPELAGFKKCILSLTDTFWCVADCMAGCWKLEGTRPTGQQECGWLPAAHMGASTYSHHRLISCLSLLAFTFPLCLRLGHTVELLNRVGYRFINKLNCPAWIGHSRQRRPIGQVGGSIEREALASQAPQTQPDPAIAELWRARELGRPAHACGPGRVESIDLRHAQRPVKADDLVQAPQHKVNGLGMDAYVACPDVSARHGNAVGKRALPNTVSIERGIGT
jgi:hypothetical protein